MSGQRSGQPWQWRTSSAMRHAMRQLESSQNYNALGRVITNPESMYYGDRAYGAYQVMGRNIPSWTRQALGRQMTPDQFLRDRDAQDRVFDHHFGRNVQKYGNPRAAASIWHSGRPLSGSGNAHDGAIATPDYVRRFDNFHRQAAQSRPVQAGPPSVSRTTNRTPAGQVEGENLAMPVEWPGARPGVRAGSAINAGMAGAINTAGAPGAQIPGQAYSSAMDMNFVAVLDQLRAIAGETGFRREQPTQGGPRKARETTTLRSNL